MVEINSLTFRRSSAALPSLPVDRVVSRFKIVSAGGERRITVSIKGKKRRTFSAQPLMNNVPSSGVEKEPTDAIFTPDPIVSFCGSKRVRGVGVDPVGPFRVY